MSTKSVDCTDTKMLQLKFKRAISRVNGPSIKIYPAPKQLQRSPFKQHNRIKTLCTEKTHRRGQWLCWSDDKLYWYFSPLLSRSTVRRGGRRGSFFFLCLYFFFASGGSSHGRTGFVLCLGRATTTSDSPLSLSISAGTDTGSSRDVTLHRTSVRGARGPGLSEISILAHYL